MLVAGVTGWGFFASLCATTTTRRVMLLLQPVTFIHNNPEITNKNLILKFTMKRSAGYFPSLSKGICWSITKQVLYKIFL